ncbi:MAG: fatty acid desaturase [Gammaproteobacteria bacterium]|nr:fatty acid desaturase [Gammaproteobacteria bacterium]
MRQMTKTHPTKGDTMDDDALFQSLKYPPQVAWPTVFLFFVSVSAFIVTTVLAVQHEIGLGVGMLINSVCLYNLFSVFHDASHSAVSKNRTFNDIIGYISFGMLSPHMPFNVLRSIHMIHHKNTNSASDIADTYVTKGPRWLLPIRWMTLDVSYLRTYWARRAFRQTWEKAVVGTAFSLTVVTIVALLAFGYWLELLMLWFIPGRITLVLISLVFIYLPHYPHRVTQKEDAYQATSIRKGWEWLLNPLFLYQNYHLVHHLYPTAPFYRLQKLWEAREHFHMAQNPAVVPAFGLTPKREHETLNNIQAGAR